VRSHTEEGPLRAARLVEHSTARTIDLSYPPHPGCETGRSCPYSPFKFRTNNTTRGPARYLTFVRYHRDRTVPDHTGPSPLLLVVHQPSHREGPKAPPPPFSSLRTDTARTDLSCTSVFTKDLFVLCFPSDRSVCTLLSL
jgi:hypothetical protein